MELATRGLAQIYLEFVPPRLGRTTVAAASPATTTRDLADLTEKGAIVREGERWHARYKLSIPVRPTPHISVSKSGELIEE